MALVDWSSGEIEAFLRMQFHAQDVYYREHFADASYEVIVEDGTPVGRLYLDRRPHELRILDIALLPQHRGKGIGSGLMTAILNEGCDRGLPVRIHVERNNPAMRLYRRLGFSTVEDQGVYWLMAWYPERVEVAGGEGDTV